MGKRVTRVGLVINWTDGAMDIGAGWGSGGDRRGDRAERYRHENASY